MPFARGDMRDHIVSHKNDHGASYGCAVVSAAATDDTWNGMIQINAAARLPPTMGHGTKTGGRPLCGKRA
jgi:hypothetical protein